jgi:hydrogenase maturation protease
MKRPSDDRMRIGVIGLGNVLCGDDAFGPYVIQMLEAGYLFPKNVAILDLGTPSLDLVAHIECLYAAIIIDSVRANGAPGELRIYNREEILQRPIQPRISPHEPGLKEALLIADFADRGPREALLVGVIPESTETGVGLSTRVRNALPLAVGLVLGELKRLEVEVLINHSPGQPRIWWEGRAGAR